MHLFRGPLAPASASSGGRFAVASWMKPQPSAAPFVPQRATLRGLWKAAQDCRGCDLYRRATQAVLGEGPATARVVMVGEQPGDVEDRQGRPFVGPAGRLLDRALADAGIERSDAYLTNAVKHFKFEERGKRRIHKKPTQLEIDACRPWLDAELAILRPEAVICLGATAAQALFGKSFRLTQHRGEFLEHPAARIVAATVHPSSLLRIPDREQRHEEYARFVGDLRRVRNQLND
jgi:uracil-DNA glycosylase family protein